MTERSYGTFVLILTLIAAVISLSPLALPFVASSRIFAGGNLLCTLTLFGPIPALMIGAVSLFLAARIKDGLVKLFADRISCFAIGGSVFWIVLGIIIILRARACPY